MELRELYRELTGYVFCAEALPGADASAAEKVEAFNRLVAQIPAGAAEDAEISGIEGISNRAQLYAFVVAQLAEKCGIDLKVSEEAADEKEALVAGSNPVADDVTDSAADLAVKEIAEQSKKRASKAQVVPEADKNED